MKLLVALFVLLTASPVMAQPTATSTSAWDPTHQALYDAAVRYRKKHEICEADKEELSRKLQIREDEATRITVVRPKEGFQWKNVIIGVLLGAGAGFAAGYAISK